MEDKFVQYIVMNRGLKMSRGKLMAQASHASMAFLSSALKKAAFYPNEDDTVYCDIAIAKDLWDGWFEDAFTKVVLAVDSESQLLGIVKQAEENGLKENRDFFIVRDNCLTELTPDETGTRITGIGFRPMQKLKMKPVVGHLPLFN